MNGVTVYPFYGSFIRKVWLFIRFLISFKATFNQAFFTSYGILLTFAKFLGSRMNCDTSDPDYPKVGN